MPALHCSELHCIIASHCMHCIAQVALKTVVADFSTFEIIKMQGNTEERAPMKAGPFGKIVADFPDGPETVDYANLLLEPKPVQKKPAANKHVLKRPAVCKKPAAAAAAPPTEDEEEGEEEEGDEDEEEELDDGGSDREFEAPAALALPSAPVPLPAAPQDCFDCMQCN